MIASRFVLLLLLLFATSTLGLKGGRVRGRQLQEPKGDEGDPANKATKDDEADKKEDKTDKKEDKTDKKSDKKDKKCKKRKDKKEKTETEPTGDNIFDTAEDVSLDTKQTPEPPEPPEPKETEKYCEDPSIKKNGDCTKLKSGDLPKQSAKLGGKLTMEVTASDDDNALSQMQKVLKDETTLSAVGCVAKRRLQDDTETAGNETVPEITLMAFEIGVLAKQSDECENSQLENGTSCSQLASTVTAHYSGDATEEQQLALFDSLTNTLQDQIANGRFSEVADVHYVDVAAEAGEGSSAKPSDGGLPIVGIAGGLVAVVALVAAGCFVYVKKRRSNCGDCGPATVGAGENNNRIVQVLSDDDDMNVRIF